jgi:uncharacterized NAD-dependent epimerase/dehydratase family protein
VDSRLAGRDAGEVLDGRPTGIPIHESVDAAIDTAVASAPRGRRGIGDDPRIRRRPRGADATQPAIDGARATHLVVGLAPDGGRLPPAARQDVLRAVDRGLNVDCGLHDLLSEDAEIARLARQRGVRIRDVRRTPPRAELHFFSGKIEQVTCLKIAVLGTDSAVGKRTTAWAIVDGFVELGRRAELVGTGQTAWLQGARYGIIMDALINDFVSGEIEHAVWSAWREQQPDAIVIEGQGSLMNPAYPGGFEILAAGRPDVVVVQHAPARREYDSFPGYSVHPLDQQIQAIELISGRPVVAITINHEGMSPVEAAEACRRIRAETGRPAYDVLLDGASGLCAQLAACRK